MADFEISEPLIVDAARQAGQIAMSYFRNSDTDVWYKKGNSPVSEADKAIDAFLAEFLTSAEPEFGWLSEETEDDEERLQRKRIFVVDPIDGTRGFIKGSPEWCISIAVVEDGKPVEGVLYCPALDKVFHAAKGEGAFLDGVKVTKAGNRVRPTVTGSKKLIEYMKGIDGFEADVRDFIPSLAYRLGLVAVGTLDGAFARAGASEWDIAAADIILSEAGCALTDVNGASLSYNKPKTFSPALVATQPGFRDEIYTLANSYGFLQ